MVNFLALLGWSPQGDEEMVDVATMLEQFALEDVNHSPAFFDVAKLTHLNGLYVRALDLDAFVEACRPWVEPREGEWSPAGHSPPWPTERFDEGRVSRDRPARPGARRDARRGAARWSTSCSCEDPPIDARRPSTRRSDPSPTRAAVLADAARRARDVRLRRRDPARRAGRTSASAMASPLRRAQAPVRVAITGRSVGPPLFESHGAPRARRGDPTARRRARAASTDAPRPFKLALKILGVVLAVVLVYVGVTFVQVWLTSRANDPHPADATSSSAPRRTTSPPRRTSRHGSSARSRSTRPGSCRVIAVTGGKRPGDQYTEAPDLRDVARSPAERRAEARDRRRQRGGLLGERRQSVASALRAARRALGPRRHRPLPRGPGDGDRLVVRVLAVADAVGALADRRRRASSAISSRSPSRWPSGRIIGYGTLSSLDHS